MEIKHIVIVGAGPVGSFMAVLMGKLGLPITVYEKRDAFTREINVKIDKGFFDNVEKVCNQIGIDNQFFSRLNQELCNQNNKILIKTLEEKFKEEAEKLGVKYVKKEIQTFDDVYEEHKDLNPIILDCTGKNSKLRIDKFGDDSENIKEHLLEHVVYINLKAHIAKNNISLYPAMKNEEHIKLAGLIASKEKDDSNLTNATITAIVAKEFADLFDGQYPDTNKNPLKPFTSSNEMPDEILQTISALISPLMIQGSSIELDSVKVKKIDISCGYAKERSKDRFICLGDSAAYLAYFRSLNVGLSHALEFFTTLSGYCKTEGVVTDTALFNKLSFNQLAPIERSDEQIIAQFNKDIKILKQGAVSQAIKVHKTIRKDHFLIVTKGVWHGCFSYDIASHHIKRLTELTGINKEEIPDELDKLNKELKSWEKALLEFEDKRQNSIDREIKGNKTKQSQYNSIAAAIWLKSKLPTHFSEAYSRIRRGYSIYPEDNRFFFECLKKLRKYTTDASTINNENIILAAKDLISEPKRLYDKKTSEAIIFSTAGVLLTTIAVTTASYYFYKNSDIINQPFNKKKGLELSLFALVLIVGIACFVVSSRYTNKQQKKCLSKINDYLKNKNYSPDEKIKLIDDFIKDENAFVKKDVKLDCVTSCIKHILKFGKTDSKI